MKARNVSEIQKREDLLHNKPESISEEAWLEELQDLFEKQRERAEGSKEETLLDMAKLVQAKKHDLLGKIIKKTISATVELTGSTRRDLIARPKTIRAPGLPTTYRAPVPFERGRISGELVSLLAGQEAALRAVLVILEQHNYEGDQKPSPSPSEWSDIYSGSIPKRSFSLSEYYEARGITSDQKGHYGGKAAEDAKQDLLDLGKSITLGPYQFDLAGGGTRSIKSTGPLMAIWLLEVTDRAKDGDWIRHEETVTVDPRPGLLRYIAQVAVTPSPLLLSGLGLDGGPENFVRIEVDIQSRIKALYDGKKYKPAVEHLATYLLTIDLEPFKIGKETLAQRIGLELSLKQGKRGRVTRYIEEAIHVALSLGIITSYEDSGDHYIFHLSKEKGRRKAKIERQKSLPVKKASKKR